jgi:hypothetical protein
MGGIEWKHGSGHKTSVGILVNVSDKCPGKHCLRLFYTITDKSTQKETKLDYKVDLVRTPCNFGGVRYWFRCPLVTNGIPCKRRVGKLYLPPDGTYFGCRHCYNLTYTSCREHDKGVDALVKNPAMLKSMFESGDIKNMSLATGAYFKMLEKLKPKHID